VRSYAVLLLLSLLATPCFAAEEPTENSQSITAEDEEIIQILELLEMLELLDNMEDVAAMEDDQ